MTARLAALLLFLLATTPARADLAPDPTDPTNPMVIVALILVVGGLGVFFYRRRRK